jgi:hypothetical protein
MKPLVPSSIRDGFTLIFFLLGFFFSLFALVTDFLQIGATPGFGVVQMFQLLVGITFLTFAGYNHIHSRRRRNQPRSLQADVGVRLGLTGLVFCYVSGLSDIIGIGTHVQPRFDRPVVGAWQLGGIVVGIVLITGGLLLYYTSRASQDESSLGFLIQEEEQEQDS